jgi:stage V sporulation protein SpoVS
LYTAPLSLKYDGIPSKLDDFVLPMIKLYNRDGTPHQPGRDAMRDILLKRANATVFASADLPDRLVDFSGGHPRELLRLLRLCCEFAEGRTIDAAAVDRAIDALASEYRRFLEPDDYALLAQMAAESEVHGGNNERTRRLLYRLALLEYNDGSWRCPHPAVKLLDGYKKAAEAAAS